MNQEAAVRRTTKDRLVDAALESLKEDGFAGTSARAIARRGGFNQALIFYHFGTLGDLLLAALDRTSSERMMRYREAMGSAATMEEKLASAARLYREDLDSGHITVISEMIAGSLSRPDLGPEVVARMEPWVEFAEEIVAGLTRDSGVDALIPPRTAAFAIVSLYLGVDLLAHLDRDRSRAEAIFEAAGRIVPLVTQLLGGSAG